MAKDTKANLKMVCPMVKVFNFEPMVGDMKENG